MATDKLCAQCLEAKCAETEREGGRDGERDRGTTDPLLPKGLFPTTVILMRNVRADVSRPR